MRHQDLSDFMTNRKATLEKGPIALIFVEDLVEVQSTITHHQKAGFAQVLVFAPEELDLPQAVEDTIHRITYNTVQDDAVTNAVNTIIEAAPNIWLYYCYNGEYLYHPFCETRTIGELLAFHTEERRRSVLSYVIDIYADDLDAFPNAVSVENAYLDKSGYYALARKDTDNHPLERQLDFFGALHWRFEEHIPAASRKIDRISLFRAKPGLKLLENHTFNDPEYNTYACPWHNNITVAIMSFRTAKALRTNSGSRYDIQTFKWHNSVKVDWTSQQLLDLGLMEPGQWF
jgi:hypothetical protein